EEFSRFLPYAVALDVEKTWADRFAIALGAAAVAAAVSDWYQSSDGSGFSASSFTSSVSSLGETIAAASSPPGSSSGSSDSGGGVVAPLDGAVEARGLVVVDLDARGFVASDGDRVAVAPAHVLLAAIAQRERDVRRPRVDALLGEQRRVVIGAPHQLAQRHLPRAPLDVDRVELAHPRAVDRREVRRGLARGDDLAVRRLLDHLRPEIHRVAVDLVVLLDHRAVVKADAERALAVRVLR